MRLAGRRLRQLYEGTRETGRFQHAWDGRNDAGVLLPPGIYLCRVDGTTDVETFAVAKVMHLVY